MKTRNDFYAMKLLQFEQPDLMKPAVLIGLAANEAGLVGVAVTLGDTIMVLPTIKLAREFIDDYEGRQTDTAQVAGFELARLLLDALSKYMAEAAQIKRLLS